MLRSARALWLPGRFGRHAGGGAVTGRSRRRERPWRAPWRAWLVALVVAAPTLRAQDLLVASRFTDEVLRFDAAGNFTGVAATGGGLDNPVGITLGPDGMLYVASGETGQVLRYDPATGASLGVFASGGGLSGLRQLQFAPDGALWVTSANTNQVLRYDGQSGAFSGLAATSADLQGPNGITFGPDGNLYVCSVLNNRILRYDGHTGAYLGVFITANKLNGPHDLAFGPDGRLYVTNAFASLNKVVRYDASTGAFLDAFVKDAALSAPLGLCFDLDGSLLVANQGADDVRRYDGKTGQLLGVVVPPMSGGLDGPLYILLARTVAAITQDAPTPAGVGHDAVFALQGARPGAFAALLAGSTPGSVPIPACPGLVLGMLDPIILRLAPCDESGNLVLRLFVPAAVQGVTFQLQAVDAGNCTGSVTLSHAF